MEKVNAGMNGTDVETSQLSAHGVEENEIRHRAGRMAATRLPRASVLSSLLPSSLRSHNALIVLRTSQLYASIPAGTIKYS